MAGWSWAQISGNGGSTNYDRRQADRRSRALAPKEASGHADHYAAKAEARKAERREAEEYRESVKWSRHWSDRQAAEVSFSADDPEPRVGTPDDDDFLERMAEHDAWTKRRDAYLQRAEGEELAARISRR
ncbi:hypothetical protein ABZ465_11355 [Streptomyces griseoincarnatus]